MKNIRIGSLGELNLNKGFYCYVGSALGKSVSLENRLMRHLSKKKKLRWHIDYLLANSDASIDSIIIFPSEKRIECLVSKEIEKLAEKTIEGFGSSDCNCKGHLHYFRKNPESLIDERLILKFSKESHRNN